MNTTEDKSEKKYLDYKKRIREIEEENDSISSQLAKARHHIKRLRVERIVLLEEIDDLRQGRSSRVKKSGGAESDSEMSISESIISDVKGVRKNAAATPRKKRDPNAPKGPGNVFFLYCRMERDNIKDEVPNESLGEVTRLLGQKWKALPKEEKQKYYDIYKKEQEEYESAMKSYTAAGGGLEGAAAVEAANKVKQEGKLDDSDEEEEIDMLQDDDDEDIEDLDEEIEQEIHENSHAKEHLHAIVSPPSSITTTDTIPESTTTTTTQQHHTLI
ncbi:hypothetical protein INT47_005494 [Mucor saturninus]|uniref:HMG box domain-containing protein n=1 Tax=Mucor saturninus TaxID=64648 RepID=A0A8H7RFC8_9FUNG|nr:hypothetical protein INT47_005494 [Mucor saturninus]